MSKNEINKCLKAIDTDGNGQITFDEFASWWIGGREGTPEGFGSTISNLM
jgi:Ca2+-binding EF-hand superfamily protein